MRGIRRGFSLIELLVVVAIVSLLSGILLPVFLQAREKARQSTCVSQLKQLGMAALLYAQDYEETMVGVEQGDAELGETEVYWGDLLRPYVRNWEVLHCPSEPEALRRTAPLPGEPEGVTDPWSYSYALNNVEDLLEQSIGAAYSPLSALSSPAETILFAEGWPVPATEGGEEEAHEITWLVGERDPEQRFYEDGNPRHSNGFALLFSDGHAGRRSRRRLSDGRFLGGTPERAWLRHPD